MAGKAKFAARMAKHLNEQIEAACPITRSGGTGAQILGGVAGAALAGVMTKNRSDVEIGQFAWLGLGPNGFVVTKAGMMGKPKGERLAAISYNEVVRGSATEAKLTLKVELDLVDGRHLAFEVKRHGAAKPSVEVVDLLRQRARLS